MDIFNTMIKDQLNLFPDEESKRIIFFKRKADISTLPDIGEFKYSFSVIEKDRYYVYKKGGKNIFMPNEGLIFPFLKDEKTGRVIDPMPNTTGKCGIYPRTQLPHYVNGKLKSKKAVFSRIFALAFIENDNPTEKTYVDHISGDTKDYRLENLEWVTPSENNKRIKKR